MALVVFQHLKTENPGRLGETLGNFGHRLKVIELFNGQSVPSDLDDIDGIVSLGGPMNVDQQDQHPWMVEEMNLIAQAHSVDIPIVGICLGSQLIATALGGEVGAMDVPEVGWAQVKEAFAGQIDPVLSGLPWVSWQCHMHGQQVQKLPAGGAVLSGSQACKIQAFKVGLTTFGFQYHFEWTRQVIQNVVAQSSNLLDKAGVTAKATEEQTQRHYEIYRHLGDRLCENLAGLLFPIDKRPVSRAGEPVKNWAPAKS